MKQHNAKYLDENRGIHTMLVNAGIVTNIDYPMKERLLTIIREELDPGYQSNLWCSPCVAEMIKFVFSHYDRQPKAATTETYALDEIVEPPPLLGDSGNANNQPPTIDDVPKFDLVVNVDHSPNETIGFDESTNSFVKKETFPHVEKESGHTVIMVPESDIVDPENPTVHVNLPTEHTTIEVPVEDIIQIIEPKKRGRKPKK